MMVSRRLRRFLSLLALLGSQACSSSTVPDHFGATQIGFDALPGWQADDHAQALATFLVSCPILARRSQSATSGSGLSISTSVWQSLCEDAAQSNATAQTARAFFERRFIPFRINNNGKESGLFTGYYEPVLYGSRRKTATYRYPLYAVPPDLKNHKPYYTRAQIDAGVLSRRGLEIVWVDDPVMVFFMQIQGSGRVKLAGGQEIRLNYADQNGRPYVSLGKVMGDEGLLPKDQINFFTLRQWLYTHKAQAFTLMQTNPSYVFFKEITGPGPIGGSGAALTPQRSLAVDTHYIPYGLPIYMENTLPALPGRSQTPFRRIVIAQDTGGAIRGPVRGDIFFGAGDEAEYLAGYMKGHGMYDLLVPKEIAGELR